MAANIPTAQVAPFSEENLQNPNQDQNQDQARSQPTEGQLINKALDDLLDSELKDFVFNLLERHPQIPVSKVKEVSRSDLASFMVQYDRSQAINVTITVLVDIGKNQLALELARAQEARLRPGPNPQ